MLKPIMEASFGSVQACRQALAEVAMARFGTDVIEDFLNRDFAASTLA